MDSTPAPATPRRMLAPAPLKRDLTPSLATICLKASKEELYLTASPEVIIMRRRTVSRGYEAIPAPVVTHQPRAKEARKLFSKVPVRRTGLMESYMPK